MSGNRIAVVLIVDCFSLGYIAPRKYRPATQLFICAHTFRGNSKNTVIITKHIKVKIITHAELADFLRIPTVGFREYFRLSGKYPTQFAENDKLCGTAYTSSTKQRQNFFRQY
eukprot:GEMP01051917.1.p1 GENE.GEMP01051917.1~~GEMP01051917.1.p1  ORF type:complete len:113 (+),score=5.74 GEMP01051917.1:175-513(+)